MVKTVKLTFVIGSQNEPDLHRGLKSLAEQRKSPFKGQILSTKECIANAMGSRALSENLREKIRKGEPLSEEAMIALIGLYDVADPNIQARVVLGLPRTFGQLKFMYERIDRVDRYKPKSLPVQSRITLITIGTEDRRLVDSHLSSGRPNRICIAHSVKPDISAEELHREIISLDHHEGAAEETAAASTPAVNSNKELAQV